jgi:hypothetical protein
MRMSYVFANICIVLLVSACAGFRDGSPSGITAPTGVASETPQTPNPAEQAPSPAEPTAGANPTAQYDNLPECEGGPNRVSGPPPGPPNGQPTCRAKPTAGGTIAKLIGVTIVPDVSEIKVGDTVDFQVRFQLDPPGGLPPKVPPPPPGTSYDPVWETDNPAIAAVTRGGNLTARALGEVTISVRYFGHSATRMLRIIP